MPTPPAQSILKNLLAGNFRQYMTRVLLWGYPGHSETAAWNMSHCPVVLVDGEGRRHWGMLGQGWPCSGEYMLKWSMRDLQVCTAGLRQ